MDAKTPRSVAAKKHRREGAHATKGPSIQKVKRTICLVPEASRRLDVHAVGLDVDVSALVERLIFEGLTRFVMHDRGDRPALGHPAGGDVGSSDSGAGDCQAEGDQPVGSR